MAERQEIKKRVMRTQPPDSRDKTLFRCISGNTESAHSAASARGGRYEQVDRSGEVEQIHQRVLSCEIVRFSVVFIEGGLEMRYPRESAYWKVANTEKDHMSGQNPSRKIRTMSVTAGRP